MISFGMMSLHMKSELSYFTEIARSSNPSSITCFRFTPAQIHPLSMLIAGERFDHISDRWLKEKFPIPQILYDRCFYTEDLVSKQSMAIVKWLKNRSDVAFIGHGLPNKWVIHETLAHSSLSPYIPETYKAVGGEMVIARLRAWKKAILKPIFGSGGAGIYGIEKSGKSYVLTSDQAGKTTEKTFQSQSETETWLNHLFSKKEYLLQPYLELSDPQHHPFDIRVLLQKDCEGNWAVRGKGIRRGHEKGILSNLSAGGSITSYAEFACALPKETQTFILQELNEILTKLPIILEESFPRLFELGIDIGLSRDHALWVLDVNSKPGRKVILETNPELKEVLFRAPLEYANYLSGKLSEREELHS